MNQENLIEKLNQHNNFHLALKVFQITDNKLIDDVSVQLIKRGINTQYLDTSKDVFSQLKQAYDEKNVLFCDETISILLPQVLVLTKVCTNLIKPIIPVIYRLKDNKEIQQIKTACNKMNVTYVCCKDIESIVEYILRLV